MIPGVWPLVLLLGFLFAGPANAEGVTGAAQVQGTDSTGNEARAFPVKIGGVDGDGNLRPLLTDEEGNLQCETAGGSSTVDVSILGQAATVQTEGAGKAADFTLLAATADARLLYWSCRESAASAAVATVVLRHDTTAATCDGPVFAYVELAANQSAGDSCAGSRGCVAASGICMDVLAGTVDCSVATAVEAAP